MKSFTTLLLLSLPAVARACMCGAPGGCCAPHGHGGLLAGALFAAVAALGYWVLQHADKQARKLIQRTGQITGFTLVVLGLAGLLCSVVGHVKDKACCCGPC